MRPTLVVVGAASRDLDPTDARGWRLGGGVTYSSLAAAHLGIRVRALVGVDAPASEATELAILRSAGIDMQLVPLERGPVFDNRQTAAERVQYAHSVSDQLPVASLPREWLESPAALLAPVAGELGDEWGTAFGSVTTVGLAAQGLVRNLVPGAPVEPRPLEPGALTERADAILISAEDIAAGAPPIREVLHSGQQMVITHGEHGALHILRTTDGDIRCRYLPPLPRRAAIDSTGAGDVFLAAWLAARMLAPRVAWRALAVAAAMASLSVERTNLADMPTLPEVCDVLVRQRDRHLG